MFQMSRTATALRHGMSSATAHTRAAKICLSSALRPAGRIASRIPATPPSRAPGMYPAATGQSVSPDTA